MSTTRLPDGRPAIPPVTVDLILGALQRSARGLAADGGMPPPGRRRPAADDLVAGYRLVRSLGRGGMAEVFEAVQVRLRRRVALKLLVMDEERRALAPRFLREARAMMQVRHLNLVAIHDAGQVDHLHYLAMELMAGGDLAARVERDGAVAPEQALRWAIGCCDGLMALHHAGLVHRDIKPGNLFLDGAGEVKIGDFGLARQVSGADRMTITGTAWGTPSYMAPEQIVGARDVDARADLYAVGATLYTLLTGREPFSGETAYLATFKAMTEPFPDPRACRPEIPAAVAAIIRMATEHARERRYSSARLLREDLERALRQERPLHAGMAAIQPATLPHRVAPTSSPATTLVTRAPQRGRRGATVLMGLALLALGWWWSTRPPAPDPGLPVWASAGGRDRFGRWVEITIGDATTRLRYRPPDTFTMGSTPDEAGRSADEARRAVTLTTGFWIQDSECDQTFFTAVMGSNPSRHRGATLPVENVDWYQAEAFCQELARRGVPARLPSEAEWEYACRAGSDEPFGGLAPDEVAWTAPADLLAAWREGEDAALAWCETHQDDLRLRAHPVAARRPNAAGLFDLHGNVLEWCSDPWDAGAAQHAAPYPAGDGRVVARGGSWFHPPSQARSAARLGLARDSRTDHLGFRFVIPQPAR